MSESERIAFFPGNRRRCELVDLDLLMNSQSEKRLRIDLMMPLTAEPIVGMPDWVAPVWERFETEGSRDKDHNFESEIEGITFEAFSTEKAKKAIETEAYGLELADEEIGSERVLVPGSTLRNFKMVRVNKDKQAIVGLQFSITMKADIGLLLWAYKYLGGTFWGAFTQPAPVVEMPKEDSKQMKLGEQPKPQTPAEAKAAAEAFFGKKANPEQKAKNIAEANAANAENAERNKNREVKETKTRAKVN